jgi:hypothetical protein
MHRRITTILLVFFELTHAVAGKYAWPALLTLLGKQGDDKEAIQEIIQRNASNTSSLGALGWLTNSQKCGTLFKPFNAEGLTTFLALYGEYLSDEEQQAVHNMLIMTGRNDAMRPAGTLDPIWLFGEFDSENYLHMSRLSGLTLETVVPMSKGPYYSELFSAFLSNAARAFTRLGRLEWDSQNYMGFVWQPAAMAMDHAGNATLRAQARVVADWVLAASAVKNVDGFAIGPDARAKDVCVVPFAGTAWFYVWLLLSFDGAVGTAPSFSDADAVAAIDVTVLGQFPTTGYRPHQALVNIAQRRFSTPVLMNNAKPFYRMDRADYADWSGQTADARRFEFETMWIHSNYTLGSLAAGRPNGACAVPSPGLYGNSSLTFSEQSVWRLGVPATSARPTGALQVFGNAGLSAQGKQWLARVSGQSGLLPEQPGLAADPVAALPFPFGTPAGRSPYEQIAQRKGALLRAFVGADTAWVGFPDAETHDIAIELRPWHGNGARGLSQAAFVNMAGVDGLGPRVYVAVLPFGASSAAVLGNYSSSKAHSQTVAWQFDPTQLSALAMQVATADEYANMSAFVAAVESSAVISAHDDVVRVWEQGVATVSDVPHLARLGLNEMVISSEPLSTGGGTLSFLPAGGGNVTMTHTGVGEYTLVTGDVCAPAGLYPRVVIDDTPLDFAAFDSWGVIEGEPILQQPWGVGQLTAQAGGAGLRITVDETGNPIYEEL